MPVITTTVSMVANGPVFVHSFMPATDTVSGTSNPSLCGNRLYVLTGLPVPITGSIVAPTTGTEFTSPWTLNLQSLSVSDVGTFPLTITASLVNYLTVAVAT